MHSVIAKFYESGEEKVIYTGSLANCIETAVSEVSGYIGYYDGYSSAELFFLKEHPTSTKLKPLYYCIPSWNTFKIYRHEKICGYWFTEHFHRKVAVVKIIKTDIVHPEDIPIEDIPLYGSALVQWDSVIDEIKKINSVDAQARSERRILAVQEESQG